MAGIVSYGFYIPKYRIKTEIIAQAWGKEVKDIIYDSRFALKSLIVIFALTPILFIVYKYSILTILILIFIEVNSFFIFRVIIRKFGLEKIRKYFNIDKNSLVFREIQDNYYLKNYYL